MLWSLSSLLPPQVCRSKGIFFFSCYDGCSMCLKVIGSVQFAQLKSVRSVVRETLIWAIVLPAEIEKKRQDVVVSFTMYVFVCESHEFRHVWIFLESPKRRGSVSTVPKRRIQSVQKRVIAAVKIQFLQREVKSKNNVFLYVMLCHI